MIILQEREHLVQEVRTAVANIIDIDESAIGGDTLFINDLGMDSLMALEILVALEKKYGIKLKESHLKQMTCLNAVTDLLEEIHRQ